MPPGGVVPQLLFVQDVLHVLGHTPLFVPVSHCSPVSTIPLPHVPVPVCVTVTLIGVVFCGDDESLAVTVAEPSEIPLIVIIDPDTVAVMILELEVSAM